MAEGALPDSWDEAGMREYDFLLSPHAAQVTATPYL